MILLKIFLKALCGGFPDIASARGAYGEAVVTTILKRLPSEIYTVLHDVTLPYKSENLKKKPKTQIDHIVLSEYGIFVLEVKHYSGFIHAERRKRKWMCCYTKKQKHKIQNPFQQNHKHLCAVQQVTGQPYDKLINLVVFTGQAKFQNKEIKGLITRSKDLQKIISKNYSEKILTPKEVIIALRAIRQANQTP